MAKKTVKLSKKKEVRYKQTPQLLVLHNAKDNLYILNGDQDKYFFSLNGPIICQAFNYIISKKTVSWIVENIHFYNKDVSPLKIKNDVQKLVLNLSKNKLIERVS
jgi:hypothetical protein